MRAGDQVRITTQLIDGTTDKHLWAHSYQRDLKDVFALQDDVARAIAEEIRVSLTPGERQQLSGARTVDPQAHELYLRARYFARSGQGKEDLQRSIDLYQEAIGKDPRYAEAYAGMPTSYVELSTNYLPPKETMPQAKAAAQQALSLDSSLAETHAVLGGISFAYDWDWTNAELEFQKAIQLNPSSADAHADYGLFLSAMGRAREAAPHVEQALRLDPLSPRLRYQTEYDLLLEKKCGSLISAIRSTLTQHPDYSGSRTRLAYCLAETGELEQAKAEVAKVQETLNMDTVDIEEASFLAITYAKLGEQNETPKLLRMLEDRFQHQYLCPFDISVVHAALGQTDRAFAYLDQAYEMRADCIAFLKVEPRADPLRADARFQKLLQRVNLQ